MGATVVDTPASLRAEAKALRKRAKELDTQAEGIELAAESARRRATSREAIDQRALGHARPTWGAGGEREGGPWVLVGVQDGAFHVAIPPLPGQPARDVTRYRIATGTPMDAHLFEDRRRLGRLNPEATMTAWRTWCEARRASAALSDV